jgi:hypothetical protein
MIGKEDKKRKTRVTKSDLNDKIEMRKLSGCKMGD